MPQLHFTYKGQGHLYQRQLLPNCSKSAWIKRATTLQARSHFPAEESGVVFIIDERKARTNWESLFIKRLQLLLPSFGRKSVSVGSSLFACPCPLFSALLGVACSGKIVVGARTVVRVSLRSQPSKPNTPPATATRHSLCLQKLWFL